MLTEYIGEKIRASALADLTWITRSAGLTEPIRATDMDAFRPFPGAKQFAGSVCEPGQYINMAPDDGQAAIAFVDAPDQMRVKRAHGKYSDVEIPVRVVLWYDTRKLEVSAGILAANAATDVITAVKAVDFDTEGFLITKAVFTGFEHDPARIWSRYGLAVNDIGMFMVPYSTLALHFKVIGRLNPACFTGIVTSNLLAC